MSPARCQAARRDLLPGDFRCYIRADCLGSAKARGYSFQAGRADKNMFFKDIVGNVKSSSRALALPQHSER